MLDYAGAPLVAIVPVGDIELLEEIEDRMDVEAAQAELADMRQS